MQTCSHRIIESNQCFDTKVVSYFLSWSFLVTPSPGKGRLRFLVQLEDKIGCEEDTERMMFEGQNGNKGKDLQLGKKRETYLDKKKEKRKKERGGRVKKKRGRKEGREKEGRKNGLFHDFTSCSSFLFSVHFLLPPSLLTGLCRCIFFFIPFFFLWKRERRKSEKRGWRSESRVEWWLRNWFLD